jgi:hypothetical protein
MWIVRPAAFVCRAFGSRLEETGERRSTPVFDGPSLRDRPELPLVMITSDRTGGSRPDRS